MSEHLLRFAIPAAYALLPASMQSPAATALLLAIALQESGATQRRQAAGGPARGFWMFERGTVASKGGLTGLLMHPQSRPLLLHVLETLCYAPRNPLEDAVRVAHTAIEHNDVLGAAAARLLLWTLPVTLPRRDEPVLAWGQYLAAWNPGAARDPERRQLAQARWAPNYTAAWALVDPTS